MVSGSGSEALADCSRIDLAKKKPLYSEELLRMRIWCRAQQLRSVRIQRQSAVFGLRAR